MIKLGKVLTVMLCLLFLGCESEPVEPNDDSAIREDMQDQADEENGTDEVSFEEWLTGNWSIVKVKDVVEHLTRGTIDTIEYEMHSGDGFLFSKNEIEITAFSNVGTLPYEVISPDTLKVPMTNQEGAEKYLMTIDSLAADKMVLTEVYDHSLELVNDNNNIYVIYDLVKKNKFFNRAFLKLETSLQPISEGKYFQHISYSCL